MKSIRVLSVACIAQFFLAHPSARADDMYIWAEEVGGDVIFYHEGSIDLTDFPSPFVASLTAELWPEAGDYTSRNGNADIFTGVIPPGPGRSFGDGGAVLPSATLGDLFSLKVHMGLPENYVSGSPISGSMTFSSTDLETLGVDTTPFTFDTTVGTNTIHMFIDPNELAAEAAAAAAVKAAAMADLLRTIRKLQKKAKKLKRKGKKAKAKKLLKKVKKLKRQLAALG